MWGGTGPRDLGRRASRSNKGAKGRISPDTLAAQNGTSRTIPPLGLFGIAGFDAGAGRAGSLRGGAAGRAAAVSRVLPDVALSSETGLPVTFGLACSRVRAGGSAATGGGAGAATAVVGAAGAGGDEGVGIGTVGATWTGVAKGGGAATGGGVTGLTVMTGAGGAGTLVLGASMV
jgi:hypothetical protein